MFSLLGTMRIGLVGLGFYACFLFISHGVLGQQRFSDIVDSTIVIHRDTRLDSLVMRHIRVNRLRDGFEGFRVQLFSGSGTAARMEADELRAEFMIQYPKIPAYLIYQAPNFKVRVGDLRTEQEAIRLQRELAYRFPGGFVVRDVVKFPELGIEQEQDEELEEDANEVPEQR